MSPGETSGLQYNEVEDLKRSHPMLGDSRAFSGFSMKQA
jgi:hypothetical protein